MSGESKHTKRLLFADESCFQINEVPAMVWAKSGLLARKIGNDGKRGVSLLLFIKGTAEVKNVHGNIGQSNYLKVIEQLNNFITVFDEDIGKESGFLLVVDNAKHHHKALRAMTNEWGHYPPATHEKSGILNNSITFQ